MSDDKRIKIKSYGNVIKKINILVELYAKKIGHKDFIVEILPTNNLNRKKMQKLKRLDAIGIYKESLLFETGEFKYLDSMKLEVEYFLLQEYPDYYIIHTIIEMLLTGIPRNIIPDDLKKLNFIYRKYNDLINKINIEDKNEPTEPDKDAAQDTVDRQYEKYTRDLEEIRNSLLGLNKKKITNKHPAPQAAGY